MLYSVCYVLPQFYDHSMSWPAVCLIKNSMESKCDHTAVSRSSFSFM
jgi:hypothetical protein